MSTKTTDLPDEAKGKGYMDSLRWTARTPRHGSSGAAKKPPLRRRGLLDAVEPLVLQPVPL